MSSILDGMLCFYNSVGESAKTSVGTWWSGFVSSILDGMLRFYNSVGESAKTSVSRIQPFMVMVEVNRGEIWRHILNGHGKDNNVTVDVIGNITRRDPTAVNEI